MVACVVALLFACVAASVGAPSLGASQTPTRGFRVIAHAGAPFVSDRRFLADAFLKKVTMWPDGSKIHPIDLPRSSPVRESFSGQVLGRTVTAVGHYWRQIIFSGRGVPPPELRSDDEVLRFVMRQPGAIGYVSEHADLRNANIKRLE